MGLSENLVQIKSETDALIDFANAKTGAEDTTLGDAVKTLVDGFGHGGGEPMAYDGVLIGEVIPDSDTRDFITVNIPDGYMKVNSFVVGTSDIGIGSIGTNTRVYNASICNYADGAQYQSPLTGIKSDGTRDYFSNRVRCDIADGQAKIYIYIGTQAFFGAGLRYRYMIIFA